MKINRTSMFYGTLVLTGTSLISQGVGFFYRIFLSRLIGAEVMGLYQLLMPVYAVVLSLTGVGLTVAVSTLSSEYHARGNDVAINQVLRRCVILFGCFFAVVAAVIALCYDPISVYFLGDARTQMGLFFLLPCIFLTGIENIHKHFFYGTGQVRPAATVELMEQFIRTGVVLGLLLLLLPQNEEKTVAIIILGMVICEVFSAVTLVTLYRRHRASGGGLAGEKVAVKVLNRRIATIAMPIGTTALLGNLLSSLNAVLIPQRLVAAGVEVSAAMSAFGVICGMTLPMLCLPTAFIGALGLVLVPKLVESTALGRKKDIHRRIHKALLGTSVIILPVMALMVVLGPTVGAALFQEPTVGQYITPLSVGVALSCYQSVLCAALNGVGKQGTAAWISLLCGGVQLGCTFFLMGLPGVGLAGYVVGVVLSSALGVVLSWWQVRRATGLAPQVFQWGVAPVLSALLMGLVANLLFRILSTQGVEEVPAVVGTLLFGVLLYLITLTTQGVRLRTLFRIS